ncbi:MAG: serine/threonine-protein kinase [Polyangiales bacterium]|nr:serine/threonine protein kinase [Myxococcales bacterium]MCB9656748.1 serine/threonine protein kinase [Sandaracinaceae bacterium]
MSRDRVSDHDSLVGTKLGGYSIEKRLGAGATGVVYQATPPGGGRPVAIKVLNDNLGHISALKRRFEREARALAKLKHPHVVHISDYGVDNDVTFIAMELLVGETLEDVLQRAPIDPLRAVGVTLQTMRGVAFAHENGIVHRDLKPANIFLRQVAGGIDVVKVLDFGLAKFLEVDELSQDATLTRKGRIVGTPAYMAPEQITGVSLDVRADVYAAGVVLYEMLADQRPFSYERRSQLLRAHLFEPVPRIERIRPGLWVHQDLERLILRALEKDPARRYADGGEMLQALQALPPEPCSFQEQRRDGVRSRTGSSSAVVISAEERLAVTTGIDDTGSMSMETVQVALDSAPHSGAGRRPAAIPDTISGDTPLSERPRGARVSAGTTSSHPRPGMRKRRKKRKVKGPPSWLWAVAVASVLVSGGIYWWTQLRGGTLP